MPLSALYAYGSYEEVRMSRLKLYATGKSGFVGRNLSKNVKSIEGDLLGNDWKQLNHFSDSYSIIHLAGVVGERNVLKDEEYAHRVNVDATQRLAEFVREESQAKFIYISSAHVYKSKQAEIFETDQIAPLNNYGKQKAQAEEALFKVFERELDRLKILRVFSILDYGMPNGTLGWAIENSRSIPVKFGNDVRDFLSASQVARIIEEIAGQECKPTVVNICTGIPTSIRKALCSLLDVKDERDSQDLCDEGLSKTPIILGNPNILKSIITVYDLKWQYLK